MYMLFLTLDVTGFVGRTDFLASCVWALRLVEMVEDLVFILDN